MHPKRCTVGSGMLGVSYNLTCLGVGVCVGSYRIRVSCGVGSGVSILEKFIVVSTLCFCLSCCLLLVQGFLLLIFEDEKLLFAEIQSIQDSPSQRYARGRESGSKHEGLQCKQ